MAFNADQPRDYHGRWGDGGGSAVSAGGHAKSVPGKLDPGVARREILSRMAGHDPSRQLPGDKVASSPAFKALFKGSGGNGLTRPQMLTMFKSMTQSKRFNPNSTSFEPFK
jgi:hypothetical protein